MKRCPDCAAEFEEDYTFCSEDGSILKLVNEMKPAVESVRRPVLAAHPSVSVRPAPRIGQSGDRVLSVAAAPKAAQSEARTPSLKPEPTPNQSEETRPISFYCPACTSEFPPPFTHCPIDQLPLKARTGKTEVAAGPKTSRSVALVAAESAVQEADFDPEYEAAADIDVDSVEPGCPEPNRLHHTDPEERLRAVPLKSQLDEPVEPHYDNRLKARRDALQEPQYDRPPSAYVDPVDPPQPEPEPRRVSVARQKTSDRPRPYIEPPPRRVANIAERQGAPESRSLRPQRTLRTVPSIVERQTAPERRTLHLEQPPRRASGIIERQAAPRRPAAAHKAADPGREVETPLPEFEFPGLAEESTRRPSFSIAAAVIAGGLLVAATIAVIAVFSILQRRAPARTPEVASLPAAANQPEVFVPTPVSALDYSSSSTAQAPLPETAPTPAGTDVAARSKNDPNGKTVDESNRSDRGSLAGPNSAERGYGPSVPARPSVSAPRIPEAESSPAARPTPGRLSWDSLSSHLVRSRSVRTQRGLRYELTFSLQDQTGRNSYLKGLQILTRSRSGATRTQSIPFSHRLGANGSLTFTVGVDMPGESAGDWGGHMSLLVTGTDAAGGPLQSRFGVPLAP